MRLSKLLLLLLIAVGLAFAQPTQLQITAPTPPAPVGGGLVNGAIGGQTVYYWVVAHYPGGIVQSAPIQVPNTVGVANFTASNYVALQWNNPSRSITSFDVVRNTANQIFPTSCTTCAVVTGTTATTVNDTGGGSAYTQAAAVPSALASLYLDNITQTIPYLDVNINGIVYQLAPPTGGGGGASLNCAVNGGASAACATLDINAGTNVTVTMSPAGNYTINSSGGGGSGTVTTVGFTGGLISVANPTTTPALTVAGTSGGIPYFSSTAAWASSALLATNCLVSGGGAGSAPATGNCDFTYATHTLTSGASGLVDLHSATGTAAFKVPSNTSNTATAAAVIDFDSSANNYHVYANGADAILAPFSSAPTTGHCIQATVSGGNVLLSDSGSTNCGGGSGTVNSGSQYQVGYYAANGTAISGNSLVNASTTQFAIGPSQTIPGIDAQVAQGQFVDTTSSNLPGSGIDTSWQMVLGGCSDAIKESNFIGRNVLTIMGCVGGSGGAGSFGPFRVYSQSGSTPEVNIYAGATISANSVSEFSLNGICASGDRISLTGNIYSIPVSYCLEVDIRNRSASSGNLVGSQVLSNGTTKLPTGSYAAYSAGILNPTGDAHIADVLPWTLGYVSPDGGVGGISFYAGAQEVPEAGTVNTQNATTGACPSNCVTWVSDGTGDKFTLMSDGQKLTIAGVTYTIIANGVYSDTLLSVTPAPGTQTAANYFNIAGSTFIEGAALNGTSATRQIYTLQLTAAGVLQWTTGGGNFSVYCGATVAASTFCFNSAVSGSNDTLQTGVTGVLNGIFLANSAAAANTVVSAVEMVNAQTASAGNQMVSPAATWCGDGWATGSGGSSQQVCAIEYLTPVQGTSAPSSILNVSFNVNGGAYTNEFNVSSTGALGGISSISTGSGATGCGAATGCMALAEASTGGTPTSGTDYMRADSTAHTFKLSLNGAAEAALSVLATTIPGTGVAAFLATPSGANFNSMIAAGGIPIVQNSQSTAYVTVLADGGGEILHPTADNNPRTFTIAANASVAYAVGTVITFVNQINTLTIAINSDTLQLAGTGTTGSRTLAAGGIATATKIATTLWYISGPGLT